MSFAFIFWFLMLLWLLSGVGWYRNWGPFGFWGFGALGFILLALLGWKVFGTPVHAVLVLPVLV